MPTAPFSLTSATDYFKETYGDASFNTYDSSTPVLSQITKTFDLSGKQWSELIPLSQGGGVGATDGSVLPTASVHKHDLASLTAKRYYSQVQIDEFAIASAKNEGAFVDSVVDQMKRAVEGFSRMVEMSLFMPVLTAGTGGSGEIGIVSATSGSNPYTLTMTSANYREGRYEEGDIVNIETGNTDPFEITTVDPTNLQIVVTRLSGSQAPAINDQIFLQRSENRFLTPIEGGIKKTTGNLYGVPVQRRFQGTVVAAGGGLTTELMDQVALELDRKTGRGPNLVVTSHTQWRKLSALLEDQKRYTVMSPRNQMLKGQVGFNAISYSGPTGECPVVTSRFVAADEMYFLNTDYLELKHMADFGWRDRDGSIFYRTGANDYWSATFGGFLELWAPPTFHGVITGLSV